MEAYGSFLCKFHGKTFLSYNILNKLPSITITIKIGVLVVLENGNEELGKELITKLVLR